MPSFTWREQTRSGSRKRLPPPPCPERPRAPTHLLPLLPGGLGRLAGFRGGLGRGWLRLPLRPARRAAPLLRAPGQRQVHGAPRPPGRVRSRGAAAREAGGAAGSGRPAGARAQGQEPRGGPRRARLLRSRFPLLLSRFAPQGGDDLKTSREDADAGTPPEEAAWVPPPRPGLPGQRPARGPHSGAGPAPSGGRSGPGEASGKAGQSDTAAVVRRHPRACIFRGSVFPLSSISYRRNLTKVRICDPLAMPRTRSPTAGKPRNPKRGPGFL